MAERLREAPSLILAVRLIVSSACLIDRARARAMVDEARQAGRDAQTFPAADEDYFQPMDGGICLDPQGGQGPQHVDRVDWRQQPAVG